MSNHRDRFASPDDDGARRLSRLFAVLQVLREVSPTLPASYAQALLAVAMKPGHGSGTYAKDLGVIQPVASRTLLEIGKKTRGGGPGLGLVDSQQDPVDLRQQRYFLTPKGRKLIDKVLQIIERGEA
jgi:DNA-binding MarR family transcriptional regulator